MKIKRTSAVFLRLLYSAIAGLLIGISALAIFLVQDQLRGQEKADNIGAYVESEEKFDGAIRIDPPIVVPDFTLDDQHEGAFTLSDRPERYILLTFGFTNCPDICPLTFSDFQQVKALLGDRAEQMAFVFISVDGRRDSPAVLRKYMEFRKLDGIIALTGDENDIRDIGAPFGLAFEVSGDSSTLSYAVNHTTGSFLIDSSRRWVMRFQFGLPPDRIAAELLALLN